MICVDFVPHNEANRYPRLGVIVGNYILEVGESEKGTLQGWIERGMPKLADLRQTVADVSAGKPAILNGHERRVLALADVTVLDKRLEME